MDKKDFLKLRDLIHSELNMWFSYSQKQNCLYGKCSKRELLSDFCESLGFNVVVFGVSPDIVVIYNNFR